MGHINSILTVAKKMNLERIFIVPTHQNPLREKVTEVSPEQRLEMVQIATQDYSDLIEVDSSEIEKGGVSYTIDTIKRFKKKFPKANINLIFGLDAFEKFDQWKKFDEIVESCNLVVTSRPGSQWPTVKEDCPKGLQELISKFTPYEINLKTRKKVFFVSLEDKNISATDIRKKIKLGQKVDKFIPFSVEKYIEKNNIYPQLSQKVSDYEEFAKFCARKLDDKKGFLIKVFDLKPLNTLCEYTVVASGTSTRHAQTLGQSLREAIKEQYGINPVAVDGFNEGRWVVLDYGAVIVHLFYDFVRQEYRLEDLWGKSTELTL